MSHDARMHDLLLDHALGLLAPEEAQLVEAELAASPALRAELEALHGALYALPLAHDPEAPAPGAWEALLARARAEGVGANGAGVSVADTNGAGADRARADTTGADKPPVAGTPVVLPGGASSSTTVAATAPAYEPTTGAAPRHGGPGGPPIRRVRALGAALAASVLLLAGSLGWGVLQHRRAALQAHEQAVVAYWMRVPGMKVVPLERADGAPVNVHPGIVCLLPDGRAMVLQPRPAPADGDYLLYGETSDGTASDTAGDAATNRVELGRTRGTLIEFHADGLTGVQLAIPGPSGGVVARASLP